jgi:hypothetical protein
MRIVQTVMMHQLLVLVVVELVETIQIMPIGLGVMVSEGKLLLRGLALAQHLLTLQLQPLMVA